MILRHLLPQALAWRVTKTTKQLRELVFALDVLETDAKAFFDGVFLDIFPATTRDLTAWEVEFGLPDTALSDADRRVRLAAAWQSYGGQSPKYLQDLLQSAGFPVYLHEWWVPGTEPPNGTLAAATPRNPLSYLKQTETGVASGVDCGEALAECGEAFAECGNSTDPAGYALINRGPDAAYSIPNDSAYWPFFLYIGGETFGTLADVSNIRKDEFEALCLKVCPCQLWLGMLINYN